MKIKLFTQIALILLFTGSTAFAQLDWFKKNMNNLTKDPVNKITQTALSETEIGQGLKEALVVGINSAVTALSQSGGYFNNENIKIPLPKQLNFLDSTLRKIGMGDKIDEFVLSMNQAAEAAAPEARDIFLDALFEMNITDAQKILQGTDTAATEYFKDKTYEELTAAFQPTIDKALTQYDVTDQYEALLDQYKTIPFASKIKMLSPDEYVISKALDGLFFALGEKETEIRHNPAARVTDLLKQVFN